MKKEMKPGLSYASRDGDLWNFGKTLKIFVESEGDRYASLRKYIGQGAGISAIFLKHITNKRDYFWIDETRVTEVEFSGKEGEAAHWYEIAELMDPGDLPFDPDDREMVSIFGFDKFAAFADLSYGC